MKILYAIQGTGNGHIARAFEVIGHLKRHGEVDILISGTQCDIKLPWKVKYRFYGMSFIFGKKGGVDVKQTLSRMRPYEFIKEVMAVPVQKYDLVLNDFEPVTAWACKMRNVKCVGVSHQSAVLHHNAPKPKVKDSFGKAILKYYAPVSSAQGFHFKSIGHNISTPVIRDDVRWAKNEDKGHYTVYLPAYSDQKIIRVLSQFDDTKWHVYSKHSEESYREGNVFIKPVNKEKFTKSMVSGTGVLCNAGFETPAEALYLGKKLCVIPMKGQYEQACNAAFLESMGIVSLRHLNTNSQLIGEWIHSSERLKMHYPDDLANIIDNLMVKHVYAGQQAGNLVSSHV